MSVLHTLKNNLFDHLAIYQERVTLLVKLTQYDIEDTRVSFKAKIIKPLDMENVHTKPIFQKMISKSEISFSAAYLFGPNDTRPLIKDKKIGKHYCPFTLWLDPELTQFVAENEDAITKQIPKFILWNLDWSGLKTTI